LEDTDGTDTYIATDEGWLYLAGIKDLFNGELVGYALDARMTQQLVMQALFRAVAAKRLGKGLIHHSDRGSQYCAHAYQKLLRQFGMQASMSRKGMLGLQDCGVPYRHQAISNAEFPPHTREKGLAQDWSTNGA